MITLTVQLLAGNNTYYSPSVILLFNLKSNQGLEQRLGQRKLEQLEQQLGQRGQQRLELGQQQLERLEQQRQDGQLKYFMIH